MPLTRVTNDCGSGTMGGGVMGKEQSLEYEGLGGRVE
jgi:hypothetical protein